jgi:hypothetical protein
MTAQDEREKEIAETLKAIYEKYGSDLSKFFEQVVQPSPRECRPEFNVGHASRYGGTSQSRQKSRVS